MILPFFDCASSARYLTDLLIDDTRLFASIAVHGPHAQELARQLRTHMPRVSILPGEMTADVVISFDALHLLPPADRTNEVARLAQLARRELVIACPLGTELQITIYRSLAKQARESNLEAPADIAQAIQYGLPSPTDAAGWAHGFKSLDLFYAGDVAFFQDSATRFLAEAALPQWRKMLNPFLHRSTFATEEPLPPETVPMRRHRRLFMILEKG